MLYSMSEGASRNNQDCGILQGLRMESLSLLDQREKRRGRRGTLLMKSSSIISHLIFFHFLRLIPKMKQAKRLQIDRHPIYACASPLKHLLEHLFHFGPNEQSSGAKHAVMSVNAEAPPSHHTAGPQREISSWPIGPGIIIRSSSGIGDWLNSGVGDCSICTAFFFLFPKRNVDFCGYHRPPDVCGPCGSADVSEH